MGHHQAHHQHCLNSISLDMYAIQPCRQLVKLLLGTMMLMQLLLSNIFTATYIPCNGVLTGNYGCETTAVEQHIRSHTQTVWCHDYDKCC